MMQPDPLAEIERYFIIQLEQDGLIKLRPAYFPVQKGREKHPKKSSKPNIVEELEIIRDTPDELRKVISDLGWKLRNYIKSLENELVDEKIKKGILDRFKKKLLAFKTKTGNDELGNIYKQGLQLMIQDIDNRNRVSEKSKAPKTFNELFLTDASIEPCLSALRKVVPPITDKDFNYLLGEHQKGAITAWHEALKQKGKIRKVTDNIFAELVNTKIRNLNLAEDGRTLRNTGTTAYTKYYKQLLDLIT